MQRQLTFGGGVSPRNTRLRGQSIIEYVLIIAIIGLVIVFAGPGVAGAIRNQFNLVGNTVNSGTAGGASGGGSAGAGSATVQAAIAKDAKDWTLDEQKAVAEDIAKNGESSKVYAKAKAAMDAGTKFSMKLTDGKTLEYRIVGIDHDDLADGSGKAGLTFLTTSTGIKSRMNATTNAGGWEKSELRAKMNSGEIWNLMPSDFQSKVKAVRKSSTELNSTTSRSTAVIPPMVSGWIVALMPRISRMLAMFDPMTLPSAMSALPLNSDTSDEASSGSDVPPATSVMAITDSLIPILRARAVALSRKSSPPKISPASPPAIIAAINHPAIGFRGAPALSPPVPDAPAGSGAVRPAERMV
mgnify:CR=1 FL=1